MTLDQQLTRNEKRHYAADDRYLSKWDTAETMVGELCRDGQQVFYVFPTGKKYREGLKGDLIDFLIRNRYV